MSFWVESLTEYQIEFTVEQDNVSQTQYIIIGAGLDTEPLYIKRVSMIDTAVPTAIRNQTVNAIENYKLFQAYPNPFNPATTITFSIPKGAFVTLEVLNTLGQTVATLESNFLTVGRHTYTWQARNQPSGLYFYRLSTAGFSQTRKMLLVR
jgi:hypothetical protein